MVLGCGLIPDADFTGSGEVNLAEPYPGVETYVTLREIQVEQDQDQDGVFDVDDNCPAIFNADQLNTDSADDGGDACDDDDDNDAWVDFDDNCPLVVNDNQADANGDGLGDACSISHNGYTLNLSTNIVTGGGLEWLPWDVTVNQSAETALSNYAAQGWRLATNLQMTRLLHSFFTFETVCNGGEVDPAEEVVCYEFATLHDDANSVGPANNFIALFGDNYKAAGHSYDFGDPVEMATAVYGDAGGNNVYVADVWDEYLWSDGNLSAGSAHLGQDTLMRDDSNGFNGVALVRPSFPIIDGDGDEVADYEDNCLSVPNTDQFNTDGADDGGNACDDNDDNDSLGDSDDNCPLLVNHDQADGDEDGIGDACDLDSDNDSVGNEIDNCPLEANLDQKDTNNDGIGNACDADSDGILTAVDNCPLIANPDQSDTDGDGSGDLCQSLPIGC